MMNFVTSIIKKYIQNELDDDSEHSMLEPVVDVSNKENGFNKPELGSKMGESTIPQTKARFSLLQEFDPLCACKGPSCKDTINKETIDKEKADKETVEKDKAEKETLEHTYVKLPDVDDDFKDTESIQHERKLEADETETEGVCICGPAKTTESSLTLTASVETSEIFFTAQPQKVIQEVHGGQSPSEDIIRQVEYESLESINNDNVNTETSEIFYPSVEKTEEQNTGVYANQCQYFDPYATHFTLQSFASIHEKNENSEVDLIRLAAIRSISSMTDSETRKVLSDLTEKMDHQQQELSELKLQLNSVKQAKAELELELTRKDEVILKTQAELMKMEVIHKQEIKHLKEDIKSKLIQKGGDKSLEEELKECKAREAKAVAELSQKCKTNLSLERSLDQYEKQLTKVLADHSKEVEEHEITKRHLVSLESAFSDVHCKYEKSKEVVQGYVTNEENLVAKLEQALATNIKHEEKYESLKAHAKNQIDKCNLEILSLKERDEAEIAKLRAIIKRLEIKCSSLEVSLQQKIEECQQLAALCDEVTGQKVS